MWMRALRAAALLGIGLTSMPNCALAAPEHFVPAFSFWSGAPSGGEEAKSAPSPDVPPARAPTAVFPRATATRSAGAVPPPAARLLPANPGGAPAARLLPANPGGAPAARLLPANPGGAPAANPTGAWPGPGPGDETQRWVPAFAFTSGALVQDVDGSMNSNSVENWDEVVTPVMCIREIQDSCDSFVLPITGDSRLVSPYMGLSAELSTPGLDFIPTRPRLFAHADVRVDFAFDRSVARLGAPKSMEAENYNPQQPDRPPQVQSALYPEIVIRGQGVKLDGEVEPWLFGGGVGVALTVDVAGRRLRIKPSVEYLRESVTATGTAHRAITGDPGSRSNPKALSRFSFIELTGEKTAVMHMLGPGLELELDTLRLGPTVLSLFANGTAYRNMGNREIKFSASQPVIDPCPACPEPRDNYEIPEGQTATADFELVLPEWSYDFGIGLRFRWLPEDSWSWR
jgi:hypothetical protein